MGRYLPGYKDGGPVRSIINLTDRLGTEYEFRILTTDRDHGDEKPYEGIRVREWNSVRKAQVYYVEPGGFDAQTVERLAAQADLIYMCGCFNDYARTVLKLRRDGRIKCKVVIASMGLFSPGAFRIKYPKKKAYMLLLGLLGYFRNVEWSATSEEEAADIRREAGKGAICHLAEDLPRLPEPRQHKSLSGSNQLRIVFLSRISRKKNLTFAADILADLQGEIVFDIYGNQEDEAYWQECRTILQRLPANIHWKYCGIADSEQVPDIFSQYDVFLFPTLAENFGHVILEALMGGCIPVISDQTPWTMEKLGQAGQVIPLAERQEYVQKLQQYVCMTQEEKQKCAEKCLAAAQNYAPDAAEQAYRNIFQL